MRENSQLLSAGFAEACQTRFEYNTRRKDGANKIWVISVWKMTKGLRCKSGLRIKPGDVLLSHTLARAVPSGLRSLTAVFGMGTGGSSSLGSPRNWGLPKG